MINWKEIYTKTLKNICEADANIFDNIVEIERPNFVANLIENPNANDNSLFKLKLDDNATEEDYKNFVEYVYGYIGEDVNDYLPKEETKSEDNDMEENKIRALLKRYGAVDEEIENFMNDLADFKEEIKEDDEEEFSPYSSDIMAKLRETEEGKDILMKAPKMQRNEFINAVKDYLAK